MCSSKPPRVKPIPNAPSASPEAIDQVATEARDRERRRIRGANNRQSTILAGNVAAPTMPAKTALGS